MLSQDSVQLGKENLLYLGTVPFIVSLKNKNSKHLDTKLCNDMQLTELLCF